MLAEDAKAAVPPDDAKAGVHRERFCFELIYNTCEGVHGHRMMMMAGTSLGSFKATNMFLIELGTAGGG